MFPVIAAYSIVLIASISIFVVVVVITNVFDGSLLAPPPPIFFRATVTNLFVVFFPGFSPLPMADYCYILLDSWLSTSQ
jgi:hypothetical protein